MENNSLVPFGFRFKPTDQELVGHFLYNFLENIPLVPPHNTLIHGCNIFGNKSEPSEIWEAYGGTQLADDQPALYFFSELRRLNAKGTNIDRKMGRGGTWTGKSVTVWVEGIVDGRPTDIGQKGTFRYENEGSEDHKRWLNNKSNFSYDFNVALCRLRKKEGSRINKRKCSTSSLSKDQLPNSKKQRCTNKKMKKEDDQVVSKGSSSQNINVINLAEEEAPQGSSCLSSEIVVVSEINKFTDADDVVYDHDLLDEKLTVDELLPVPEASRIVCGEAVAEQALNPLMLEEFTPETQELPLPAASVVAAEGAVEQKAWDPSLLDEYWLAETQQEPFPTTTGMFPYLEEACNPSTFENVNHSLFPPGFRFKPTDQELIGTFLHYFLVMTPRLLPPPPHNTFMHKCNLFGNRSQPSQIWDAFGGGAALQLSAADQPALYFFSELKRVTPKGSKLDRKMGLGGTWEGKSVPAWVEGTEGNSTCIGLKRTFWYKNEGTEDHGGWKLDEYSLFASPRKRNSHTGYDFDFVLCRLRNTSGINKRKCSTSSSHDDEVPKMKKKRANKEIEQNMHAINVEEEGRRGNSCLTSNSVVSDQENNEFPVDDYVDYGYDDNDQRLIITIAELNKILAKEPTDGAVEVLFPTASASEELLLGNERQEVPLSVSSTIVVAHGEVEDEALNPNMLEESIPEARELPLPAVSGTAEDGTVEEKAWDPSLLEQYWLAETQEEEPLNPSFYRDFMFADGGGVEEAYHPSAFDNVVDQSLFGSH
ncbi:unnamed protein product [Malus baccata var. baccata]